MMRVASFYIAVVFLSPTSASVSSCEADAVASPIDYYLRSCNTGWHG